MVNNFLLDSTGTTKWLAKHRASSGIYAIEVMKVLDGNPSRLNEGYLNGLEDFFL